MSDADAPMGGMTVPSVLSEQVVILPHALARSLEQTRQNVSGQLRPRSQRIYQIDMAAFLWWLRANRAGEVMPGRYQDHAGQAQPSSPAEDSALLSCLTRDEVIAYRQAGRVSRHFTFAPVDSKRDCW